MQKINFNLGTKSADEVLNAPTDLAFSSPLSPLSVSSFRVQWRKERETWRGRNFYFLKAGHDLGRGKANETSPHARASKRMHDTRLALQSPLCERRPKGDNAKWGSRSPFTTRPKDLKNRPAVRRRMAARRIGKPEVVDGSVHPPAGRGRTAVR